MKVIATEKGYYKGDLIKPMQEFEFTGKKCGKWFVPVDQAKPETKTETKSTTDEGPTAKEIKAQLEAAGVPFKGNASKVELLALLKETVEKASPGAPTADKDLGDKTE